MGKIARRAWWVLPLVGILGGYWLLPISGQVIIVPGGGEDGLLWPQMRLQPPAPRPGEQVGVRVVDAAPWSHVLLTVDGLPAQAKDWPTGPGDPLVWEWVFTMPEDGACTLIFYRDCGSGCVERGRLAVGVEREAASKAPLPTKLGVVFAHPERDWRGRSGWDVELTYARRAGEEYWGVDDLAARVRRAADRGLRVLVRVDYDYGQSVPPAEDYLALAEYLQYLRRLARDGRLRAVYGYIIGSGYNSPGNNVAAPGRPLTPEWYARLFNGYGAEAAHSDNVIQTIRAENPAVRVLVGPVTPWETAQNGALRHRADAPWLNYMNTLVAALDEGTRTKAAAGIPLAAPDGFAVQAPGRPGAMGVDGRPLGADEPRFDVTWGEGSLARGGFRVYRDWMEIINAYPATQGLPLYITSANTYAPDERTPPAQNYPRGWLTTALEVVNAEPQVHALCWFIDDFPHDTQWDYFSLTRRPGRLLDAAEEFDALLEQR